MYDSLWRAAFAVFLCGLPLNAAQAIILSARQKAGRERVPGRLVWLRRAGNVVIALGWAALTATIIAR